MSQFSPQIPIHPSDLSKNLPLVTSKPQIKPITLSILPSSTQVSSNSTTPLKQFDSIQPPIYTTHVSTSHIPISSNQTRIPNFNHVPIAPVTMPNNLNVLSGTSSDEKERARLEKQCQRVKKYNEKVKAYKKIALIDSNHEKIKALLLICYPELSQMSPYELDMRVIRMMQSLGQPL
jgi:hypothetical protein